MAEMEKAKTITIKCKHCGVQFRALIPQKSGTIMYTCPSCKKRNGVKFNINYKEQENKDKAHNELMKDRIQRNEMASTRRIDDPTKELPCDGLNGSGCLEIVRFGNMFGGLANTRFPLRIGINTIGRADEDTPSDINIKNDPTISRRSITIDVVPKETGSLFKLKILRAANPVLHNEMLNYGKSDLVKVSPKFGGEQFDLDARLSFKRDGEGNVSLVPHFIRKEQKLDEHKEHKFSDEDRKNLRETGNLGRVVDLVDKETGDNDSRPRRM